MSGMNPAARSTAAVPESSRLAEAVLQWAQLLSPLVLLVAFITATAVHGVLTSRRDEDRVASAVKGPGGRPLPATKLRRRAAAGVPTTAFGPASVRAFQAATAAVVLSFIANAANVVVHAITDSDDARGWWCGEEAFVYIVGSCSFYSYILLTLFDWDDSPNAVHAVIWVMSLAVEAVVFGALLALVSGPHAVLLDFNSGATLVEPRPTPWDAADLGIGACRLIVVLGIVLLYAGLALQETHGAREKRGGSGPTRDCVGENEFSAASETTPLLGQHRGRDHHQPSGAQTAAASPNANGSGNGAAVTAGMAHRSAGQYEDEGEGGGEGEGEAGQYRDEDAAFYRPEKLPHKTWWEYMRGYSLFLPYLWPRDAVRLQAVVLFCFVLLVLQRYVNILVPDQTGRLADSFKAAGNRVPWRDLGLLIVAKVLQGPSGLLGSLRAVLWIPVSQYCYRALASAAFEHVHSLSLDFHLSKRTGEVLSALSKGEKINEFLEQVTFQVFPTLVDLLVAIVYFQVKFNSVYAVCVSVMTFAYLFLTIRMAAARSDERRNMTNADREEEAVKNDSIVSYETVKYFNAEEFEFQRYRRAIAAFQEAEAKVVRGATSMNVCQNLVFVCGMLLLLMVGSHDVVTGQRSVGDFMAMVAYLGQLQGPLNFFGTFYRQMQQAMISGERMLELFKITPTVVDRRVSPPLPPLPSPPRGHIRWSRVRFWYHDRDRRRPALRDISFECRPGTTTAFVGESGGGKSTVFRLMYRYYNCHSGAIEIDGHDVTDVTIDSVRRAIGVVPQDTILFNETVMYNLRYANQAATKEEVYAACRAASIHDRILGFPDGYDTVVGERGQCLSGGERQRVAIARLLLKNPKIIMLDEATSALDSHTEQQIQSQLIRGKSLGQDCTLLIIAHRLSTITHADQIIVLHAGSIVEKGTHLELLELGGKYASMWQKQSKAEEAASKARDATARANKLLRQAQIGGSKADSSDDSDGYNSTSSSTVIPHSGGPHAGRSVQHPEDSSSSDEDLRNRNMSKSVL